MRPRPTARREKNQPRSQSEELGTRLLRNMPSTATAIAATDTPLTTGAMPSSTSARRRIL